MKVMNVTKRLSENPNSKVRIYIFPANENVFDNLLNRYSRPSKAYKAEVLPAVFARIGEHKVSWSQKAGCNCGCSPGFIVTDGLKGFNVFVDVE